jgi:serine/threonine-protein kinase
LAIDGGSQTVFANAATNGLGTTSSVAVTSGGTVYIADATNNRIVVKPASGSPTAITTVTGVTPSTLNGPKGVAVDAANNVYIADTGNNRILKYNPITSTATALGNNLWIPGASYETAMAKEPGSAIGYTATTTSGVTTYTEPGPTGTTAPPQYTFKAPQGLAVDQWGNVYVADTGNGVVVEIPSNSNLGGATPLLQYTGAPAFTAPVAIAIGPGPLVTQKGLIENTADSSTLPTS